MYMIVALAGNNSFALRERLDELTAEFVKKYGDLAVEKFDGTEVEFPAVLDAVQSHPFLAERKLVIVRDASDNKQLAEQIEQIISSISDSTDLIFYEPLTDKRTTFYKTLKAKSQFEEFNELDAQGLTNWLLSEATLQGLSLQRADANYLMRRIGQNQQRLASELEKLATYDKLISRESVDYLTEPTPQSKIFDLLDAAFGGNKPMALKLYSDQRAQKVEPQAILAMLAWQLNILTLCKLAGDRQPAQIAKDAGLSPFPVMKASSLARRIDDKQLKKLVHEALEMDFQSKTKTYDLDEALKTYIAIM